MVAVCGTVTVRPTGVGAKFKADGKAVIEPARIEIRIAELLMVPEVAMTFEDPNWAAVPRPLDMIVADAPSLLHVTELVRFCVLPSV